LKKNIIQNKIENINSFKKLFTTSFLVFFDCFESSIKNYNNKNIVDFTINNNNNNFNEENFVDFVFNQLLFLIKLWTNVNFKHIENFDDLNNSDNIINNYTNNNKNNNDSKESNIYIANNFKFESYTEHGNEIKLKFKENFENLITIFNNFFSQTFLLIKKTSFESLKILICIIEFLLNNDVRNLFQLIIYFQNINQQKNINENNINTNKNDYNIENRNINENLFYFISEIISTILMDSFTKVEKKNFVNEVLLVDNVNFFFEQLRFINY
jgi:hypothetical protein